MAWLQNKLNDQRLHRPCKRHLFGGTAAYVQGYHGLLRMTSLLLAEQVPPNGHVLVLGVGGGLEFKTFAEDHAGRQFAGVTRLPKYSASPKPILAQILNG